MSQEYNKRLKEWGLWYHEQLDNGALRDTGDPIQQIRTLKKAVDGLIELNAIAARDIQRLERAGGGPTQLIVPKGARLNRNIRAHGQ